MWFYCFKDFYQIQHKSEIFPPPSRKKQISSHNCIIDNAYSHFYKITQFSLIEKSIILNIFIKRFYLSCSNTLNM